MKTSTLCKWCLWILFLFVTQTMYAQKVSVSGTVISEIDNEPVAGTSVVEKGTANGTVADFDGRFYLDVASGATIQINYIGFVAQEVVVNDNVTLNIVFSKLWLVA